MSMPLTPATFPSFSQSHLLDMDLHSLCICLQCCQNHHLWTEWILYPKTWYRIPYHFWLRNSLQNRWSEAMGHTHGIHWSCLVTHNSEATNMIERYNHLSKAQSWHQVGSNTLWDWSKVLQIVVNALNQYPLYCCFSHSQICKFRNQRVEMKAVGLIITALNPLVQFLFPILTTLGSAALEILVPKGGMLLPVDTIMIPLNWSWYCYLTTLDS